MGGSSSKEPNYRQSSSLRSNSPSWSEQGYSQPSYENQNPQYAEPYYAPESHYNVPPPQPTQSYGGYSNQPKKTLDRRYSRIADEYTSLEQNLPEKRGEIK